MSEVAAPALLNGSESKAAAKRFGAHGVLLIAYLLYTFVGTHPLADTSVGARVDGSPLDRIVVVSMFLLSLAVLWENRRAALSCALVNAPFLLVVAFSLLSISWSDYPDLTLRRASLLFLLTVIAMAIAVGIKDLRSFHTLLFVSLTAVVVINLLATALSPSRAISDIGVNGLYSQKNVAGIVGMIAVTIGASWILGASRRRSVILGLVAMILAGFFLFITRSKTSMHLTLLALCLIALFALAERFGGRFVLFVMFICFMLLAALFSALAAIDFDLSRAIEFIFTDASFTGRDEIWAFARKSASLRPWLGYGYGAFWDVGLVNDPLARLEPGTWLADVEPGTINQAHNGYLELWLHLGMPATIFATLIVIQGMFSAAWRAIAGSGSRQARALLGGLATLLFLHLFHNFTEATLFMRGSVFFNVIMVVLFVVSRADDLLLAEPRRGARGAQA
jgi:O-antigen ligase